MSGKPAQQLADYRRKRNFGRTPEPAGGGRRRGRPRFVVQQHDATSLHYDFRLEAGGVLKSWAVPKGPSLNPKDKRLAIRTEDHPLDYADFEGVIPGGEYGAGPVIVWDRGTHRNLTEQGGQEVPVERAVEAGYVKVWLEGAKRRGGFALTRAGGGERPWWLLVKLNDEHADPSRNPVIDEPRSVLSGRTIQELAAQAGAWPPAQPSPGGVGGPGPTGGRAGGGGADGVFGVDQAGKASPPTVQGAAQGQARTRGRAGAAGGIGEGAP